MGLSFNQYQLRAHGTAEYCVPGTGIYPSLGLSGESGELIDKCLRLAVEIGHISEATKKLHRDHGGVFRNHAHAMDVALELGDVLWYLSAIAGDIGFTLEQIAELNVQKVESRQERGVLHGSGDNR